MRNISQRQRNMLAKAGESDRAIRVKMVCGLFLAPFHERLNAFAILAKTSLLGEAKGRQNQSAVTAVWNSVESVHSCTCFLYFLCTLLFFAHGMMIHGLHNLQFTYPKAHHSLHWHIYSKRYVHHARVTTMTQMRTDRAQQPCSCYAGSYIAIHVSK